MTAVIAFVLLTSVLLCWQAYCLWMEGRHE